jgi:hypothetical protein
MAMCKLTRNRVGWSVLIATLVFWSWPVSKVASEGENAYVGSKACQDCHENEFEKFKTFAKKAHSYESIKVMKKGLTDSEFQTCFECHTTGYGKPGGFRSEHDTPDLRNAGCEVCHGPGSLHCETEDPGDIMGSLTADECEECHRTDRVEAFDYKPLIYGGAH